MPKPQSSEVTYPEGKIRESWFPPDESVSNAISTWIDEGWEKAEDAQSEEDRESAAIAWAHYRAFDDVATRMEFEPDRLRIEGEMEEQYTEDQRRSFKLRAKRHKNRFHSRAGSVLSKSKTRSVKASRDYP